MLAAIGAIGASALSSAVNMYQQEKANKANQAMARDQMQFQERMSNTSHKREVEDLKSAGLNPILSVHSGASSPVGATSTSSPGHMSDLGPAVSTGLQARNATKLQEQQNEAIQSGINKTNSDIGVNEESKKLINAQQLAAESTALNSAATAKRTMLENRALNSQMPALEAEAKFKAENPTLMKANVISESVGKALGGVSSGLNIWNLLKKPDTKYAPDGTPFNKNTGEIMRRLP